MAHRAGAFRVVAVPTGMAHRAGLPRPVVDPFAVFTVTPGAPGYMNVGRMLGGGARPMAGDTTRLRLVVHRVTRHTVDAGRAHRVAGVTGRAGQSRTSMQRMIEVADLVRQYALRSADSSLWHTEQLAPDDRLW